MKHWDLIPNELVTLRRGLERHSHDPTSIRRGDQIPTSIRRGDQIRVRFLFHTTRLACFYALDLDPKAPPRMLEFEALEDGSLRERNSMDFIRRCWHAVGPDRHTRTIVREPIGERRHYSVGTQSGLTKAAKGASA